MQSSFGRPTIFKRVTRSMEYTIPNWYGSFKCYEDQVTRISVGSDLISSGQCSSIQIVSCNDCFSSEIVDLNWLLTLSCPSFRLHLIFNCSPTGDSTCDSNDDVISAFDNIFDEQGERFFTKQFQTLQHR